MADQVEEVVEGNDASQSGLKSLAEEITCPLCQEHFRDPRILPCCHYYCLECIQQIAKKAGSDKPFCCPECRKETLAPSPGGIDKFPNAFFVHRMKTAYTSLQKAAGKVEALCEMCSGAKVEAFCRQCTDFICADCVKAHAKLKIFSGHNVVSLDELKNSKQLAVDTTTPLLCEEHGESLKIFCFDCNCLICRDCTLIEHAGHRYEFVKKAAALCRSTLQDKVAPLHHMHLSVSKACDEIQKLRLDISTQGNDVVKKIKQSFRELSQVLEQHEKTLLSKTSSLVNAKLQSLNAQEKALRSASTELQSILGLVQRSSEEASDEELMTVQFNLLLRVEEECKKLEEIKLEVEEDANLTVSVLDAATIQRLCEQETGVDLLVVEPQKCSVESNAFDNVQVGKPLKFNVHTVYTTGQAAGGGTAIVAELRPVSNSSQIIRANGVYVSKGVYEVVCTPDTRGRHEMSVTVNSQDVANSPFNCFVGVSPTELETSCRTFEGMKKAWGVAATTDNTIYVTDWKSNKILVFSSGGERLGSIAANCLYAPRGIAVDKEGHIIVSDGSHAVFKLNQSGQVLKSVTWKSFQFNEPAGILIGTDNHVYVCDRGNHRVAVFTMDLSLVAILGEQGTGSGQFNLPESIAQDQSTGKLYISDYENQRIHVLTPDREFVTSFGEEHLEAPTGLAVDSHGHLYVADFRRGTILVFSIPSYTLLTTIALPGPDQGHPSSLALDGDEFLYVCDFFNRRVVVF